MYFPLHQHSDLEVSSPIFPTKVTNRCQYGWIPSRLLLLLWALVLLWLVLLPQPAHAQDFDITDHHPLTNAVGVTVTANISATFSADVDVDTVNRYNFAVHSFAQGLLTGNYSVSGNELIFDSDTPFFAGEQVQVIATGAISSTLGDGLSPIQWSFTAGPVLERCVGVFEEDAVAGANLSGSDGTFADYDNDGDLDILSGSTLYRNDVATSGLFVEDTAAGINLIGGGGVFADYDSDGDVDLFLTSRENYIEIGRLYRNEVNVTGEFVLDTTAGEFLSDLVPDDSSDVGIGGIQSLAFGDYDNDSDLDILVTGSGLWGDIWPPESWMKLFRNEVNSTGEFVEDLTVQSNLIALRIRNIVAFLDYDSDGDLDIVTTGNDSIYYNQGLEAPTTRLYRNEVNTAGEFVVDGELAGVVYGSIALGDYDNDADVDLLITGMAGWDDPRGYGFPTIVKYLYRNDFSTAGGFVLDDAGNILTAVHGSADFGDYDNDGDLDILVAGDGEFYERFVALYRNNVNATGGFLEDKITGLNLASDAQVFGDYDNDGNLDILSRGGLYRNQDCADPAISKTDVFLPFVNHSADKTNSISGAGRQQIFQIHLYLPRIEE